MMETKSKVKKLIILNLFLIFFLSVPSFVKGENNLSENSNVFQIKISDKDVLENIRGGKTKLALQVVKSNRIILWDESLNINSEQLKRLTGNNNMSIFKFTIMKK